MAEDFFELTQDEGFRAFPISDYQQQSVESAREWIKKTNGKYAVVEQESFKIIGMGGLMTWIFEGQELVDITYRLRSDAQGKGYGVELAKALLDYGFESLNLEQITATIHPDNEPSKKLAEKLGLRYDKRIELLGVPTDLYRIYNKKLKE